MIRSIESAVEQRQRNTDKRQRDKWESPRDSGRDTQRDCDQNSEMEKIKTTIETELKQPEPSSQVSAEIR